MNKKEIVIAKDPVGSLEKLRSKMADVGCDACIIPSEDYHDSEYVNDHFKMREHYSGFDGSAGTLMVLADSAYLWTDGRYFLQAEEQLKGTGITLMKQGEPGIPKLMELLRDKVKAASKVRHAFTVYIDGRTISSTLGSAIKSSINREGGKLIIDRDLAGECWDGRPALEPGEIFRLPIESAGLTFKEKLYAVRSEMERYSADYLLISDLMETAWLFNLRGSDIDCTPVFYAYTLVSKDGCTLFTLEGALPGEIRTELSENGVLCEDYDDAKAAVDAIPEGSRVWADLKKTNCLMTARIALSCDIIDRPTPIEMMKAVKNEIEIKSTKSAHIKDGAAVSEFISWVKDNVKKQQLTELSAAHYLDNLRFSKEGCFDLSFPTISAYGTDGAIIHYEPTPKTDKPLSPEGFLLVDSGGQYFDGTTDITRTISLGPLSDKMRKYYTLVLKSHITMERILFRPGTTGAELDKLIRKPLTDNGLDFNHGTGHGVGHVLSVHEGPNIISKHNAGCAFVPGMITSDEPGVYIENEFGIRLENVTLCVDKTEEYGETSGLNVLAGEASDSDDGRIYGFEPLTYVPFDRDAIIPELLTDVELEWLNSYHQKVYELISPNVPDDAKEWLKDATAPITTTVIS